MEELNRTCANYGTFRHYVGFRYANPLTEEAIAKIKEYAFLRFPWFHQC